MSLKQDIAAIIERIYAAGNTGTSISDELRSALKKYIESHPLASKKLYAEAKHAAREYMKVRDELSAASFGSRHAASAADQQAITQRIMPEVQRVQKQINRASSRIIPFVMRQMERAASDGSDWRKLSKTVLRRMGIVSAHVSGEIETAKAAMDRIARFGAASDVGVEYFRYAGPTANLRPFCSGHIGAIYSIDEIEQMSNGQGLPVWSHCGGYNCRHRWVPVANKLGDWRKQFADEVTSAAANAAAQSRAIFPHVTANDISRLYGDLGQRGIGVKLEGLKAGPRRLELAVQVVDRSGAVVGYVQRSYRAGEAHHDVLMLADAWQGKGISQSVLRQSLEFYDAHGIHTVHVHAALDGGHIVWAKYGFEFAEAATADQWRASLARYISEQTSGLVSFDRAMRLLASTDSPHKFVTYKAVHGGVAIDGEQWKRDYYPNSWRGILDLAENSRSRRIFTSKLSKGLK